MSPSDIHHLSAAEGWLGLGDWRSANDELENINPVYRADPAVLALRLRIYSDAKHWELALEVAERLVEIFPDDSGTWVDRSFALHEMKRTKEAHDLLLPALEKFPDEAIIPYNLGCYACQLGEIKKAKALLSLAFERGDENEIKLIALDDPDLAPLWKTGA